MKKRNITLLLLVLAALILLLSNVLIFAQNEVSIVLNDKLINFPDAKPYLDEKAGRVLVPVRFIAENLGAAVRWDPISKQVDIVKDETNFKFRIGEQKYKLNNIEKLMDTAAFILEDRALVPLRTISEDLGLYVGWDKKTYTVMLNDKDKGPFIEEEPDSKGKKPTDKDISKNGNVTKGKEFVIQGVKLGQSEEELISILGQPNRKDLSEYGFRWYIYNNDYNSYIQVGVENSTVVGIYTNADNWKSASGLGIGSSKRDVERVLGIPLENILKGNTRYLISGEKEKGVFLVDDSYVSLFYDIHNQNTVTSVQVIDKNVEYALDGYYGRYSEELRDSFERQVFDLANAIRVRNGLEPFTWSDKAQISSRKHSQDMANNNFFDHTNLKKESPFDRMKKENIVYAAAGENIAAGSASAIQAHEGWMNSKGHRVNILGDFKTLGVGVGYSPSTNYKYYYTQNFFTGR